MQRVDSDKKKMSEVFGELFTKSSQNIMSVKGKQCPRVLETHVINLSIYKRWLKSPPYTHTERTAKQSSTEVRACAVNQLLFECKNSREYFLPRKLVIAICL